MENEFGRLLKSYRDRYATERMSQADLAKRVDRVPSDISRWERGKRQAPDRDTVLNLAKALELDLAQKNRLLQAAGYMLISEEGLDFANPALQSLALALTDAEMPADEKEKFQEWIQEIVHLWSESQKTQPGRCQGGLQGTYDKYVKILRHFDRSLDKLRVLLWTGIGKSCEHLGQLYEAHRWYETAYLASKFLEDREVEGELLLSIGDVLRGQRKRSALEKYKEASSAFAEDDDLNRLLSERKRASVYLMLGWNYEEARRLLEKCVEGFRRLVRQGDSRAHEKLCRALYFIGWAYSLTGKPREGIEARSDGLRIARELGDEYLQALGHRLLGDDYDNRFEFDDAQIAYENALNYCDTIADPQVQKHERGHILRGLGSTLTKRGDWPEAQKHLQESLDLFRNDPLRLAHTMNEIGKLYAAQRALQLALETHRHAISLFESVGNEYYPISVKLDMAEVLYQLGKQDGAIQLAKEARDAAAKSGSDRLITQAGEAVAYLLLLNNEPMKEVKKAYTRFLEATEYSNALVEYKDGLISRAEELNKSQQFDKTIALCDLLEESFRGKGGDIVRKLLAGLQKQKKLAERQIEISEDRQGALHDAHEFMAKLN